MKWIINKHIFTIRQYIINIKSHAEECQAKCTYNEVPNDSCNKGKVCEYALYVEYGLKHCYLADMMCNIRSVEGHYFLFRKGNNPFSIIAIIYWRRWLMGLPDTDHSYHPCLFIGKFLSVNISNTAY